MMKFKVKVTYEYPLATYEFNREYYALAQDSKTALLDVITEFNDVDLLKVSIKCLGEK